MYRNGFYFTPKHFSAVCKSYIKEYPNSPLMEHLIDEDIDELCNSKAFHEFIFSTDKQTKYPIIKLFLKPEKSDNTWGCEHTPYTQRPVLVSNGKIIQLKYMGEL